MGFWTINIFAEHLPVKIYTSADGLGSSFINAMLRDSRGFLWFATRDGLSRFDGREFTTYQIGASEAPPGIEQIYQARNDIYWIATTAGIYRFDPNRQSNSQIVKETARNVLDAQLIAPDRGTICEDSKGRLWVGGGFSRIEETADGKFSVNNVEIDFPDENWRKYSILKIFEAADASLWLTTNYGLIRRLPDERMVFYTFSKTSRTIKDSIADAAGRIWVVADNTVEVFAPEAISTFPVDTKIITRDLPIKESAAANQEFVLPEIGGQIVRAANAAPGELFHQVFESSDQHIWISAGSSILEFNGQNRRDYNAAQGFIDSSGAIAEDINENLWFSGQSGAARLNRFGMSVYGASDGLNSTVIQSLYTRGNELYAVSADANVSRFNGRGFETVRLPIDKDASFTWLSSVAFPDSRGEWWALTQNKLYRFAAPSKFSDLATEKPVSVYTKADGLKGSRFFRMFEDSKGNIWIATRDIESENIGLTVWNRADEKFHAFSEEDGFPKNKTPSSFAEDADGTLWFGIYSNDDLLRYKDGKFSTVSGALPKGFFTAILFDHKNRLWLASAQSGITRIDNPNDLQTISARYTTDNGLSSNNVRSLAAGADGEIYAGTVRGVDRIAPETENIRHYSVNDGLNGDFVNAAVTGPQATLWFGSPNGLSRFTPPPEKEEGVPTALISGLRVAGETRYVPPLGTGEIKNLELAANQNNLQVGFFAVNFGAGESLRYQYKLEGTDPEWSKPAAQRTVNYANLAPGNYRFLVRAVRADGVASKPSAVTLNILAPFYRRWWFISLAILLACLGFLALDRYRVRKTRQVKRALDISQKSEQAALLSETRYRTLAETASDAIITIDEASLIVYVNGAAEKIFGYRPAELIGKSLTDLMPEDLRSGHDHGFHRYLTTHHKNLSWSAIELPGHHKSGAIIPLELSFGEFESEGKRYFTGVARDISERKRAEADLERSRTERLTELELVRSRIARDLHDDVGSSLTQIALFSEVAKQNADGANINREPLEFLVQTSNELVEAMSDIVWAINPSKDHFLDLTQRMRRFSSEILTAADIDLEFIAPEAELDAPLGANLRREIFLIFKESINNIVKHSNAHIVNVNFSVENNLLRLEIKDDGTGFQAQEKRDGYDWRAARGGNGLPGMKRRAQELGGDFSVESKIGIGTVVILNVLLDINLENTISPD